MNRLRNIPVLRRDNKKRYFVPLKYPEIPLSADDLYVITTTGDRLDLLADQFYNDIRLWWIIAAANPNIIRRDSFALAPNIELRIPSNEQDILDNYEDLNK
tara:strand:+ start:1596 stop:1898 length:303 start_codon:yes stop_codon:yes gene_type:complete